MPLCNVASCLNPNCIYGYPQKVSQLGPTPLPLPDVGTQGAPPLSPNDTANNVVGGGDEAANVNNYASHPQLAAISHLQQVRKELSAETWFLDVRLFLRPFIPGLPLFQIFLTCQK